MRKKKGLLISLSFLLAVLLAALSFYFSRPLVVFFTAEADPYYVDNLEKPDFFSLHYRTRVVTDVDDDILNKADLIINHSVIGLDKPNEYIVGYDPLSLIAPYVDSLGDGVTYLYDSSDGEELAVLSFLVERVGDLNAVSYDGKIDRSEYGIYKTRVGTGLIITLSLDETIGFIRTLDEPEIAVSYLDAAALETLEPSIVFSPEWDLIIEENLRKGL